MVWLFSARSCLRWSGAAALLAFVFCLGSLFPLQSAASMVGPGATGPAASFTVNHFRKGDRLPVLHANRPQRGGVAVWQPERRTPEHLETSRTMPLACDPAISPFGTPSPVIVYGRCSV